MGVLTCTQCRAKLNATMALSGTLPACPSCKAPLTDPRIMARYSRGKAVEGLVGSALLAGFGLLLVVGALVYARDRLAVLAVLSLAGLALLGLGLSGCVSSSRRAADGSAVLVLSRAGLLHYRDTPAQLIRWSQVKRAELAKAFVGRPRKESSAWLRLTVEGADGAAAETMIDLEGLDWDSAQIFGIVSKMARLE